MVTQQNTIGGFVDAMKDFRNDVKRLLAIVEGVSMKETLKEIKRLNENLEKVDPALLMMQMREVNNMLERIDIATLSRVMDVLRHVDINGLQRDVSSLLNFLRQLEEEEGKKKK